MSLSAKALAEKMNMSSRAVEKQIGLLKKPANFDALDLRKAQLGVLRIEQEFKDCHEPHYFRDPKSSIQPSKFCPPPTPASPKKCSTTRSKSFVIL
jgi:hypothetical protein